MRAIDPAIFEDEFINTQTMMIRYLWIGLIVAMADDQGRMLDNPSLMKIKIFPYDSRPTPKDINDALKLLNKAHKILRYRSGNNGDGKELIQIVKWWKYQKRTQWAVRSQYPAPVKWVDRVRCHEHGSGQKIVTSNWDLEGGFMKRLPKRLPSPLPSQLAYPLARREEEEEEYEEEKEDEKPTTPLPPPSKKAAGGGGPNDKDSNIFKDLNQNQKQRAEIAAQTFRLFPLRDAKKINSLSVLVATRNSISDVKSYLLAALASAYADKKAENKIAVACYRIEHDAVESEYLNAEKWEKNIPNEIIKAMGL